MHTDNLGEPWRRGGVVLWLTGLSGAGKTTVAFYLQQQLSKAGRVATVLDGDTLRDGLCADLGFSPEDRAENVRRVAEVARLFAGTGVIAIAALISPYRRDRAHARSIVTGAAGPSPFLEIFVDAPLDVCEHRDPKGLYAKARAGVIPDFTGISAPYEPPDAPDLTLHTDRCTVAEACDQIVHLLSQTIGGTYA